MGTIEDELKEAIKRREDHTIIGAIVGFALGFVLGMDGLIGVAGAVVIGWLFYCAFSGDVERIRKIQEIKK